MPAERYIYALTGWTVEERQGRWYYAPTANRHTRGDWKGPYRSIESVTMMIARELRKEIAERYDRQKAGRSAA